MLSVARIDKEIKRNWSYTGEQSRIHVGTAREGNRGIKGNKSEWMNGGCKTEVDMLERKRKHWKSKPAKSIENSLLNPLKLIHPNNKQATRKSKILFTP